MTVEPRHNLRMQTKVALVTGGARGIGRGIVERFLESGASVALFDVNREAGTRAADELCGKGKLLLLIGDVGREDDVRRAVQQTVDQFGALDVLVNNAGIEVTGRVDELSSEAWDRQLTVNLKGAFLFSKYAVPPMRGKGGVIVNISSVHAFYSYPGCAAYDASKAGMIALTRTMAIDHGCDGIRVNAVCPGYIDTPMLDEWLNTVPDRAATVAEVMRYHPLGRIGTPRDIAEAVHFLASDAAAFITGTYLIVDGAMTVPGH